MGAVLIDAGEIAQGDLAAVDRLVESVLTGSATERWLNLTPEVDEERAGPAGDSVLFSFLAARGPSSPLATVMAGGVDGIELGIQHRAGVRAAEQLADADVVLPEGWVVRQDHPRRGLVVAVPAGAAAADVAAWVAGAIDELNRAPVTGRLHYRLYGSD